MKKIFFPVFCFFLLIQLLTGKDRETILFGVFHGRSYATGHYEDKQFKFGEFYGYNVQFFFSKNFGLKLEWMKQNKEVFYTYNNIWNQQVHKKWDDRSLMMDIVFKYPIKYFTPYLQAGFGAVEASNGEEFPIPSSPVGRLGAGAKFYGRIEFLFFYFNVGLSYFTKYQDGFLRQHTVNIRNNQRWSIYYSFEFGF